LRDNEEVIALPDSLFAKSIQLSIFDQEIRERQQKDEDTYKEWRCIHHCQKVNGALYKDGELVVTAEGEVY